MKNHILISILLLIIATKSFGANDIRIFEVYGGGGNSGGLGAPYNEDFVVLYNEGSSDITTGLWSIQYASAGSGAWNKLDLNNITIKSKGFYVIEITTTGTVGATLPYKDVTWSLTGSGISYTDGKIALMNNQTLLTTNGQVTGAVDLFGYGSATAFEGTAETSAPGGSTTNTLGYIRANGVDTDNNSSDFVLTNSSAPNSLLIITSTSLPVNLISFTGKNQGDGISLSWQTASEIGSDYFEVQKSNDFKEFITLAKINSVGNSQEINNYGFLDTDPNLGVNYYRLKQYDLNGDVKVYNAISVNFQSDEIILNAYPNPLSIGQELNLKTNKLDNNLIVIYNSQGQKVDFEIQVQNPNFSTIQFKNINTGVIMISSKSNPKLTKKIVIN